LYPGHRKKQRASAEQQQLFVTTASAAAECGNSPRFMAGYAGLCDKKLVHCANPDRLQCSDH
jgi:hypothetical protein